MILLSVLVGLVAPAQAETHTFIASAVRSEAIAKPEAVAVWCTQLGARLHSVSSAECHSHHFVAAQAQTERGHALISLDVDAAGNDAGSVKHILLIGGIHGDELTSVSIVFSWLRWLPQGDAASYKWRIIPSANPDGLLARPSTRVNSNGVDLNRNFQTPDWDKDALDYWVHRTRRDPRRFPGQAAGSEIETRWLETEIADFRPDLIISVHAPYNLLDYDGPVPEPMRFGRLSLNRLGVYPGSMGNYSGLFKQIPIITIELPSATQMPSRQEQLAMWQDMLAWIGRYIRTAPAEAPAATAAGPSVRHAVVEKATPGK